MYISVLEKFIFCSKLLFLIQLLDYNASYKKLFCAEEFKILFISLLLPSASVSLLCRDASEKS